MIPSEHIGIVRYNRIDDCTVNSADRSVMPVLFGRFFGGRIRRRDNGEDFFIWQCICKKDRKLSVCRQWIRKDANPDVRG